MASLSHELRKQLENTVIKARRITEVGARKTLTELAVHRSDPWDSLTEDQRQLRNRLRAHGRQLGDRRDMKTGIQTIDRLVSECGYEHWHRMLFARFLAESNLLIEPETRMAITLDECRELAIEQGKDWLALATDFAVGMLPQIFRQGDPVLEVSLPRETRQELEELLKGLPSPVFTADDSLGWVYQFWQTERKKQVNDSGAKIGADELPAVTQLFTEDYMVLFLLHNTLGAWWTARRRAQGKCPSLPAYEWTYLRLKEDGTPAAGGFDSWPHAAKYLRVLDPCMGSGHFLVFTLPILVRFRMEEEGLSRAEAVAAVLRENLFGLEIDNRCTQIAAFNLALAAWRLGGYRPLPSLHLACSGLGINAKEEDWLRLAGQHAPFMKLLYEAFLQAPILGSLIDPRRIGGDLFVSEFDQARQVLERALVVQEGSEAVSELAVTAKGLVDAAQILADSFTLVATNVPYIGYKKQDGQLKEFCDLYHAAAKHDLATCFVERCVAFCVVGGTAAVVTPQNWLFLGSYKKLRKALLRGATWNLVARLGARAFETISGEIVNVSLISLTNEPASRRSTVVGLDVSAERGPAEKEAALRTARLASFNQLEQIASADSRLEFSGSASTALLSALAISMRGIVSGDSDLWMRNYWELPAVADGWRFLQTTVRTTGPFLGREHIIDWHLQGRGMLRPGTKNEAYGKLGVAVGQMGSLPATLYSGELYDNNTGVIVPLDPRHVPAIWTFCSSPQFYSEVRKIDQALKVTNASLVKVHFDLTYWQQIAAERYPDGLPKPQSDDPTQWVFKGHPKGSEQPLQVAVVRLLGYRWPRQTGSNFLDCPAVDPDGLESQAAADGIVCLRPVKGEAPAADRLRALLGAAFGPEWSAGKQAGLLAQVDYAGKSLEDWLRDGFFEDHCEIFQPSPFIWHVWDGLRDGFHALVNYHQLAAPNGEGRRTLERLVYYYLGDWIDRQCADQKSGVEGSDARLAAALHLKSEFEKILTGDPPYDIFVRWKALHEQPIGWEPDINDGVRINIRPFMAARPLNGKAKDACILRVTPKIKWDKDRGKEPDRPKEDYPWFWKWDESLDFAGGTEFDGNRWNDLHYSREFKQQARQKKAGV